MNPPSDWDAVYKNNKVEDLPWFLEKLDPDIRQALLEIYLTRGSVLDIGVGAGTQPLMLHNMGYTVTGTDISPTAVLEAKKRCAGHPITIVEDDILNTHIVDTFDLVIDRGVFHIFDEPLRAQYVDAIMKLVMPGGYYFLKTFSIEEKGDGPYRFSIDEHKRFFSELEWIKSIDTVYYGTHDPLPKAIFSVFKRGAK